MLASTEPASSGPSSIRQDIRGGLTIALGFSILAFLIIVVGTVAGLLGAAKAGEISQLLRGLPLIIAGYFAAGFLGGVAFWATRPLRRWLVGWALTGAVLGTISYGAVGLSGVLGYVYFGVNIFDFKSQSEAWSMWPGLSIGIGVVVGLPVGIYYWFKDRAKPGPGAA